MRRFLLCAVAAAALAGVPAASAAPPLPSSIAAIGDSISQAYDVCCWYGNHPAQSWSTGNGAFDGISSHYERLLALTPRILGHNYDDAVAGARMRDAAGQAQTAVSQGAQYVTILMGANDACTSSQATMTSVSDFTAQFQTALTTLETGLPSGAQIFVASIPNIYRLWQLLRYNATAEFVWYGAQICQSMLSPLNTEADRQTVLARVEAFNQVLAQLCGQYTNCRFDNNAVFNYAFASSDVSRLDYFHPSLSGQARLAEITWQQSWWPSG